MALAASHVETSMTASNASSYNTGSQTPTSNALQTLWVVSAASGPNTPTVSGCGLTWVEVTNVGYDSIASPTNKITMFRALGASPSTGALTIDFGGQTQSNAGWSWQEWTGVDTGGTNGSAAIVQSATNSTDTQVTTLSVTLAAFGDAGNGTAGGFGLGQRDDTLVQGTGFTLAGTANSGSETHTVGSEYRTDNDTGVDMSWTSVSRAAGIAVEVKAAVANQAPAAPTSCSGTASGDSITMTFTDNTSGAAQHRAYYRRSTDSIWTQAGDLDAGETSFAFSWLNQGTSYDVGITSFDADAESAMSKDEDITTGTVRLVSGSFL